MDPLPPPYRRSRFVFRMRYPEKQSLYSLHFKADDAGKAAEYAEAFGGAPAPVGTTADLIEEGQGIAVPLRSPFRRRT